LEVPILGFEDWLIVHVERAGYDPNNASGPTTEADED
jgi:hypothetical protein